MKTIFCAVLILCFSASLAGAAGPTFGDLAVLLAKGYFDGAVSADAPLEECVAFLNEHGVYFSMFDLIDPDARVKKEDFARAVGQSRLVLQGEATLKNGVVQRPNGINTWVDYCLLNDVDLQHLWGRFVRRIENAAVPEVEQFLQKAVSGGSGKAKEKR